MAEMTRPADAEADPPQPGSEALYARVAAVRERGGWSAWEASLGAGVKLSVLVRLAQGLMPGADDLAAIEAWLAAQEPPPQ
jgi:hypothetical protein